MCVTEQLLVPEAITTPVTPWTHFRLISKREPSYDVAEDKRRFFVLWVATSAISKAFRKRSISGDDMTVEMFPAHSFEIKNPASKSCLWISLRRFTIAFVGFPV